MGVLADAGQLGQLGQSFLNSKPTNLFSEHPTTWRPTNLLCFYPKSPFCSDLDFCWHPNSYSHPETIRKIQYLAVACSLASPSLRALVDVMGGVAFSVPPLVLGFPLPLVLPAAPNYLEEGLPVWAFEKACPVELELVETCPFALPLIFSLRSKGDSMAQQAAEVLDLRVELEGVELVDPTHQNLPCLQGLPS